MHGLCMFIFSLSVSHVDPGFFLIQAHLIEAFPTKLKNIFFHPQVLLTWFLASGFSYYCCVKSLHLSHGTRWLAFQNDVVIS